MILGGCNANTDTGSGSDSGSDSVIVMPEDISYTSLRVADNLSVFRSEGRTFTRYGGLACDLSCTGIRFNANCVGKVSVRFRVSANCYFTVYINGERMPERLLVTEADLGSFVEIADIEEYGAYEIAIAKQSQYPMAYCEIAEVQVYGTFGKKPAQRKRFIEFYGDSVLNGSNIHTGGTSVVTSDATLAYGYLTARALNADCNIIGRGGMGFYPKDSKTDGMNEIWDLCGGKSSPEVAYYDFGRVPDCVVVQLGVNDIISDYYTDKRYQTSIKELIFNLRSVYGEDIRMVWCINYHERYREKWDVVQQAIEEVNDSGTILFCELPDCALPKDKGGDGWHPNVKMSYEVAEVLTDFINENIY